MAVSLRACIFGVKLSWGFAAVSIVNTATEVLVSLQVSGTLSYFAIWRIRRLLADRYYGFLLVLNGANASLEEVVISKSMLMSLK